MQSCKLICIPYAGLCNRISCLMSALYLADNYSRFDVNVYWNNSNECKGYFDQLFEPLERVNFKILRLNSRNILYNRHIPSKLKKIYFDEVYQGSTNDTILKENFHGKKIYVSSANKFIQYEYKTDIAQILFPLPHIYEKIEKISKNIRSYCERNQCGIIGIHIRRTDNKLAIQNSPLEFFLQKIDKIYQQNKSCFYLSTDDNYLKETIIRDYAQKGIKIFTYNGVLKRDSLIGMEDAIIDLWLLGRCEKIIGSNNSSFSMWASRLYNSPLEIKKD